MQSTLTAQTVSHNFRAGHATAGTEAATLRRLPPQARACRLSGRPSCRIYLGRRAWILEFDSVCGGWMELGARAVASSQIPSRSGPWQQRSDMPKNMASTIVSSRARGTHAPRSGDCAANRACRSPGGACFSAMHDMDASTMPDSTASVPRPDNRTSGDARCGWSNSTSARHWA
jgi:hypothetical protein